MMVVKASGSIGSRGGTAVTACGGGIESRSLSRGSNFGNSAKFERSFSGRSLASVDKPGVGVMRTSGFATIAGNPRIDTKGVPSFTISKTGSLERSGFRPAPQTGNKEKALRSSFGPRIEAVRGFSHDNHRPSTSAFKNTKPLFVRKSEVRAASIRKPETNIFQQTKKLTIKPGHILQDVTRHASALRDTRPVFSRIEVKPYTPEVKQTSPRRETHPLYTTTVEQRATGRFPAAKPMVDQSLYERRPRPVTPGKEKLVISESGEIRKSPQRPEASATWRALLQKRQAHPDKVVIQQSEALKKLQPVVKKASQLQTQTQQRSLDTFLRMTEPLSIKIVKTIDNRIQENVRTFAAEVKPRQNRASAVRRVLQRPVIAEETEKVFKMYAEQHIPQLVPVHDPDGIVNYRPQPAVDTRTVTDPRVRTDVQQAARVMAAYQAVIDSGTTTVTKAQAERSVLAALDRSLEKSNLKTQLIGLDLQAAEQRTSPALQLLMQQKEEIRQRTEPIRQPVTRTLTDPEKQQEATPQTTMQTGTVKQTVTAQQENQSIHAAIQLTRELTTNTRQVMNTEEALLVEEQEEEYRRYLELGLPFERDDLKDIMRMSVAVYATMMTRIANSDEPISGVAIAETMVDLYDVLVSPIVPRNMPDDYLTDIIEKIAAMEFANVREVSRAMYELVQRYPAIMVGEENNISKEEALKIRFSKKYPTIVKK